MEKKIKFEDDCGGMKPLPLIKKKESTTTKKTVKGSKKKIKK